jgi:hypothetical protein
MGVPQRGRRDGAILGPGRTGVTDRDRSRPRELAVRTGDVLRGQGLKSQAAEEGGAGALARRSGSRAGPGRRPGAAGPTGTRGPRRVLGNAVSGDGLSLEGWNPADAAISTVAGATTGLLAGTGIGLGSLAIMNSVVGFDATLASTVAGCRRDPRELVAGTALGGLGTYVLLGGPSHPTTQSLSCPPRRGPPRRAWTSMVDCDHSSDFTSARPSPPMMSYSAAPQGPGRTPDGAPSRGQRFFPPKKGLAAACLIHAAT